VCIGFNDIFELCQYDKPPVAVAVAVQTVSAARRAKIFAVKVEEEEFKSTI